MTQIINLSAGGGWVTTSNLSTVVPPATRRDLEIACYAANRAVQVTEVGRHTVTVLCEWTGRRQGTPLGTVLTGGGMEGCAAAAG